MRDNSQRRTSGLNYAAYNFQIHEYVDYNGIVHYTLC